MIDVNELELRHKKYKIKSYIPYAVITLSIFIILISLIFIFDNKEKVIEKKEQIVMPVKEKPIEKKVVQVIKKVAPKTIKSIEVTQDIKIKKEIDNSKKEQILLSPSLDFMKNMQTNSLSYYNIDELSQNETNYQSNSQKNQEQKVVKKVSTIVEEKKEESQRVQTPIIIEKRITLKDIQDVIRRFKKNNNPALSLFIAKRYYAIEDYEKSYNYALITNDIDSNIEQSWIIFAKSLVKLHKKQKAIKILNKYINHTHSHSAKLLLDNITSGAFK